MINCDCRYESIDYPGLKVIPIIVDLCRDSYSAELRLFIAEHPCMTRHGSYRCVICGTSLLIQTDCTVRWTGAAMELEPFG